MTARVYFSHGIVFLFDSAERSPGSDWTEAHGTQGFARRPAAVTIGTLIEGGCVEIETGSPFVLAEEAPAEEPTRVREHGEWVHRVFVETADVAQY